MKGADFMVKSGEVFCPKCGGDLKFYDIVTRFIKSKYGVQSRIKIRRLRCIKCKAVHREIPDGVMAYKQYESEMIQGVVEGIITSDTLGFEDYPCELTMKRWIKS